MHTVTGVRHCAVSHSRSLFIATGDGDAGDLLYGAVSVYANVSKKYSHLQL
jgi:hypothetical protein